MRRSAMLGAVLATLILAGSTSSAPRSGERPFTVDSGPVWSADGTRIAFIRNSSGVFTVRSIGATGARPELLGELPTEPPGRDRLPIEISPDWTKVAYGGGTGTKIVDVEGTGVRDLTVIPLDINWSPDSRFLSLGGHTAEVYVVRADGSDLHKVADGLFSAWAPDGNRLALVLPNSTGLAIVSRDGTGYREIWHTTVGIGAPAWAPTGDMIAFFNVSERTLQIIRPDGTRVRTFAGSFSTNLAPAWSFDGTKIAVPNGNALSVFDVASGRERRFPYAFDPSWAPHSEVIAAGIASPCSSAGIHVLSLRSGGVRRLTLDCRILGSARGELLQGTDDSDVIFGRGGNDRITGFGSADRLFGGAGADRINGGPYAEDEGDLIDGGPGNDVLDGGRAQQTEGAGTDDVLLGRSGSDVLRGGPGHDDLEGGNGNDTIQARDGERDLIRCGTGHDVALVDRRDRVGRDCEAVRIRAR